MENLSYYGVAVLDGHEYDDIKVDGRVTFQDTFDANFVTVRGKIICKNNAHMKELKLSGEGSFDGDLIIEHMNVDGKIKHAGSTLKASRIMIYGVVETAGDVIGETIKIDGVMCAKNVKGKKIVISDWKSNNHLFSKLLEKFCSKFVRTSKIGTITGDDIDVSNTNADIIEGKNICIRSNCNIKKIVCSGEYYVALDSKVGEFIKK